MADEELLPPPPPKRNVSVSTETEGLLPPPPPKKKITDTIGTDSSDSSTESSPYALGADVEKEPKLPMGGEASPYMKEFAKNRLNTQKQKTIDIFKSKPDFYSKPENRDAFYAGLKKFGYSDDEMAQIVGDDFERMVPNDGIMSKYRPNPIDPAMTNADAVGAVTNPAMAYVAEKTIEGTKAGAERISQGEALRMAGIVANKPELVAQGILKTAVGGGEIGMAALNVIPEMQAFTLGMGALEKIAPKASEWLAPVSKIIQEKYKEDKKPVPTWVEDLGLIGDFLVFADAAHGVKDLAKSAKELKEKITSGKKPTEADISKIKESIDAIPNDAADKIMSEVKDHTDIVKKQQDIEQLGNDLDANPDLADVLKPKLEQSVMEHAELVDKQATKQTDAVHSEIEQADIANQISNLEASKSTLSDVGKGIVDEKIKELNSQLAPKPLEVKPTEPPIIEAEAPKAKTEEAEVLETPKAGSVGVGGDVKWNNTGTEFKDNKFSKDGKTFSVKAGWNRFNKDLSISVLDENGKEVSVASFKQGKDGKFYSEGTGTTDGSFTEKDFRGKGLMKSVYDFVDKNYGEVKPSKKLTNDGLGFWESNRKQSLKEAPKAGVVKPQEAKGETIQPTAAPKETKAVDNISRNSKIDYVINKLKGKVDSIFGNAKGRLSDKESLIFKKEIANIEDKAVKSGKVSFNPEESINFNYEKIDGKEQKINVYEVDGYKVEHKYARGSQSQGYREITTPSGERIIIYDKKYKNEQGSDIVYFKSEKAESSTIVAEIKSKPLTHAIEVEGEGMGANNKADGTYLSTEKGNRYSRRAKRTVKAEVDIENPLVIENDTHLDVLNNEALPQAIESYIKDNANELSPKQIKELRKTKSHDETTNDSYNIALEDGIQKYVSKQVTDNLKAKGHDSIYIKEGAGGEGELIVFDKKNVKFDDSDGGGGSAEVKTNIGTPQYKSGKNQVKGRTITKTIANGEKIKGTYKVVSADDIIASHNESTFSQSENFPKRNDGKTANDRDYEQDRSAQAQVIDIAQKLDDRAVSQTPVVSNEGIVLDGNNRTMSRKLAAKNGTDGRYIDALKEQSELYGIDAAEIDNIKNPMLVFEAENNMPYTTETFKKFNVSEKKEKSPVDKAIEISKTISDRARNNLFEIYENSQNASEITSSPSKVKELINLFEREGLLQAGEMPRYFNKEKLTATKEGVAFIENVLLGSALKEDVIRTLDAEGMGTIRLKVLSGITQLVRNSALGENSLINELEGAIEIHNEAKATGQTPTDYINQMDLFKAKDVDVATMAMAIMLDQKGFKTWLNDYNNRVGKLEVDFDSPDGKIATKLNITDEALKVKLKNYDKVRSNIKDDAKGGESKIKPDGDKTNKKDAGVPVEKPKAAAEEIIKEIDEVVGKIKPAWESNIEAMVHPETGLAAVFGRLAKEVAAEMKPLRDKFLKDNGLDSIEEYRKLSDKEQQKLQQDYTKIVDKYHKEKELLKESTPSKSSSKVLDITQAAEKLYNDIADAEGAAKKRTLAAERQQLLEENPSIKYIDDNIKSITKQLEDAGLLKKKGNCP